MCVCSFCGRGICARHLSDLKSECSLSPLLRSVHRLPDFRPPVARFFRWSGCKGGCKTISGIQPASANQSIGAGNAAVDGLLGLASHSSSGGCKALLLRTRAAVAENLRWNNLFHLKFTIRQIGNALPFWLWMQRLPNLLAALGVVAALAG